MAAGIPKATARILCGFTVCQRIHGGFFTSSVTSSAGANGRISPSGPTEVNPDDNQIYSITPDTGYHVSDVIVDGTSVGAVTKYMFSNVAADHTIGASFAIDTYALTASAGTNGSIDPAGTTSRPRRMPTAPLPLPMR